MVISNKTYTLSPRTRAGTRKSLAETLRTWDTGSKVDRRRMLEGFVESHSFEKCSTFDLEAEYGNGASLLFSRLLSWLRITQGIGYALALQLRSIRLFFGGSSPGKFVEQFQESGGVETLLDIMRSDTSDKGSAKLESVVLLNVIATMGRRQKEMICQCGTISLLVDAVLLSKSIDVLKEARNLFVELGTGNPRYQGQIYGGLIRVLPGKHENVLAQIIAAQASKAIIREKGGSSRKSQVCFIPAALAMLYSTDAQVQYEAQELLHLLARESEMGGAICTGIVQMLEKYSLQNGNEVGDEEAAEFDGGDGTRMGSSVILGEKSVSSINQECAARVLGSFAAGSERLSKAIVRAGALAPLVIVMLSKENFEARKVAAKALLSLAARVRYAYDTTSHLLGQDVFVRLRGSGGKNLGAMLATVTRDSEAVREIKDRVHAYVEAGRKLSKSEISCRYLPREDASPRQFFGKSPHISHDAPAVMASTAGLSSTSASGGPGLTSGALAGDQESKDAKSEALFLSAHKQTEEIGKSAEAAHREQGNRSERPDRKEGENEMESGHVFDDGEQKDGGSRRQQGEQHQQQQQQQGSTARRIKFPPKPRADMDVGPMFLPYGLPEPQTLDATVSLTQRIFKNKDIGGEKDNTVEFFKEMTAHGGKLDSHGKRKEKTSNHASLRFQCRSEDLADISAHDITSNATAASSSAHHRNEPKSMAYSMVRQWSRDAVKKKRKSELKIQKEARRNAAATSSIADDIEEEHTSESQGTWPGARDGNRGDSQSGKKPRYNRKSVVMAAIEKAKTGTMHIDPSSWQGGARSPGLKKAGLASISSRVGH